MDLGFSALTRRERLERIATAERDRRSGRVEVAVAALGEPTEWPARVVLALARLDAHEGHEARRVLEEGLDVWASDVGLDSLDVRSDDRAVDDLEVDTLESAAPTFEEVLAEPIDNAELERAFEEAEAQVDEMHDVNDVAERVLLDEPQGFGMTDDLLTPVDESEVGGPSVEIDRMGMDAAWVDESPPPLDRAEDRAEPEDRAMLDASRGLLAAQDSRPSRALVLATLERWLDNLERNRARRMQ